MLTGAKAADAVRIRVLKSGRVGFLSDIPGHAHDVAVEGRDLKGAQDGDVVQWRYANQWITCKAVSCCLDNISNRELAVPTFHTKPNTHPPNLLLPLLLSPYSNQHAMSDRHNGWRETAGGSETQNSALVQPALAARVSHDGPAATRKAPPAALARSVSAPPAGDAAQASRLTMVRLGLVAALDGLVADGTLPQDTAAKFKPMILDGPHVAVSCAWIALPAMWLAHQKAPLATTVYPDHRVGQHAAGRV